MAFTLPYWILNVLPGVQDHWLKKATFFFKFNCPMKNVGQNSLHFEPNFKILSEQEKSISRQSKRFALLYKRVIFRQAKALVTVAPTAEIGVVLFFKSI